MKGWFFLKYIYKNLFWNELNESITVWKQDILQSRVVYLVSKTNHKIINVLALMVCSHRILNESDFLKHNRNMEWSQWLERYRVFFWPRQCLKKICEYRNLWIWVFFIMRFCLDCNWLILQAIRFRVLALAGIVCTTSPLFLITQSDVTVMYRVE